MATPHNIAKPEDIAKTVLMPGDPLRSKFIADNFLENPVLFNNVRGIQGYTGMYKGTRVSVMASGMGMPSMGIYSYELFNFFGVENIIRIGSIGGMREDIKVRDIVIGMGACSDSNYDQQFMLPGKFAPIADYTLLSTAVEEAKKLGATFHVGNVLSSDVFYDDSGEQNKRWHRMGVLGCEMEAAALYMNAARAGKRGLAICTVSNNLVTGEQISANDIQTTFTEMMEVALNTAVAMDKL